MTVWGQLPSYEPAACPDFVWAEGVCGADFVHCMEAAYEEVVGWRRNLFMTPSGKAGKTFISETTRLLVGLADATAMEGIALKAMVVFHVVCLQKPSATSTSNQHLAALESRLAKWSAGNVDALLREGRAIQQQLPKKYKQSGEAEQAEHDARVFARLVMQGKIKAAIRYVCEQASNTGVLSISQVVSTSTNLDETKTVGDILQEKHPVGSPMQPGAVLFGPVADFQPVIFSQLDGDVVRQAALRSQGAPGPSGVDAAGCNWKRMCCSFGTESTSLCNVIAALARRLCCSYVDPRALEGLVACRLIPLNKNPRVRPIGVGEMLHRLVAKSVLSVVRGDITQVCGAMELCAGQCAGEEAAVHAISECFQQEVVEAALFVDASNAFNSLNRAAAMHNIRILCPSVAIFIINIYRRHSRLFIVGGGEIISSEGTTQGDPMGMAVYALTLLPLVSLLWDELRQAWF